jgi:hypothetical protein
VWLNPSVYKENSSSKQTCKLDKVWAVDLAFLQHVQFLRWGGEYGYINMKTGLKTLIDLLNIIMNVYNW